MPKVFVKLRRGCKVDMKFHLLGASVATIVHLVMFLLLKIFHDNDNDIRDGERTVICS